MKIAGLQKTSLIDYPPYICCVIFLEGCNYRCGFCHNPELVLGTSESLVISQKEILEFLEKRKKWLDAVCITGGEPCLNKDLPDFIKAIKSLDYKVKLDSNGTNPDMLKSLFDEKLLDYIAMDVKGPLEKYESIVNAPVDKEKIKKSVALIMASGIAYEFRTTVVPGLIESDDFKIIGQLLNGARRFVIQQFRSQKCLNKNFEIIEPFSSKELENFKKILVPYIKEIFIREN